MRNVNHVTFSEEECMDRMDPGISPNLTDSMSADQTSDSQRTEMNAASIIQWAFYRFPLWGDSRQSQ
jgi:hypothetical protein